MFDKFNKVYKQIISQQYDLNSLEGYPEFQYIGKAGGYDKYSVQDSYEGMMAVRRLVDQQYGPKRAPWALIARIDGTLDNAWKYWQTYGTQKEILLQNGKLKAFGVDGQFYDMQDRPFDLPIIAQQADDIDILDKDPYIRYKAARKSNASMNDLHELSYDKDERVSNIASKHLSFDDETLPLDDSREGMEQLRRMLDRQYGTSRCPWAFTKRSADGSMDEAWESWQYYQPEYVTLKNGKIISITTNAGTYDMFNRKIS